MKRFIANIPFWISVPFQGITKVCSVVIMKLIQTGGKLHVRWKTPLGLRLIEAKKQLSELDKNLGDIQSMTKKLAAKKRIQSDSSLATVISKGKNDDPTFH